MITSLITWQIQGYHVIKLIHVIRVSSVGITKTHVRY